MHSETAFTDEDVYRRWLDLRQPDNKVYTFYEQRLGQLADFWSGANCSKCIWISVQNEIGHWRGARYFLVWSYIRSANSVWVMRKYCLVTVCFLLWLGVQARVTKSKQKVRSTTHLKPSGSSPWSCKTKSGESCVLPFNHGQNEYMSCSAAGSSDAWCPTGAQYAQGGQYNYMGRKGHGWNWCDVNECQYGECQHA